MGPAIRHYKILVISDYRSVISSRPEAELFVRLAHKGHEVHIITHPEANSYKDRFEHAGIRVFTRYPKKKISGSYIRFLRQLVKDQAYNFVHVFTSKALTNAVWALRGLPAKLIAYRGYAGQNHWFDPTMYLKYFHPRVDYIWCVSRDIEHNLAQNMPWGKRKLKTIPKGHDPAWYDKIIPADRASLGLSPSDIVISFVANVRPFKGLQYLLQATHLLPADLPIQFVFAGHGYDAPGLQREMKRSPLHDRLHILGYRKDAAAIVAASDCFILTSTHGEGLSKSVVEAMSIGIAPIVTQIPANDGVVVDGESGWVIPARNPSAIAMAIIQMAEDSEERKRRGSQAKQRMQTHFHLDQTVEAFERWYNHIKAGTQ